MNGFLFANKLMFVMFIVKATSYQLDNHQASSQTQSSNHMCRPPKSTVLIDQFRIAIVILNFDWCQTFILFQQFRVKQVSQVLLCALTQSHKQSSLAHNVCF